MQKFFYTRLSKCISRRGVGRRGAGKGSRNQEKHTDRYRWTTSSAAGCWLRSTFQSRPLPPAIDREKERACSLLHHWLRCASVLHTRLSPHAPVRVRQSNASDSGKDWSQQIRLFLEIGKTVMEPQQHALLQETMCVCVCMHAL